MIKRYRVITMLSSAFFDVKDGVVVYASPALSWMAGQQFVMIEDWLHWSGLHMEEVA